MVLNSEKQDPKIPMAKTSGLAIWSLLLGILSLPPFPFSLLTGIPAIICGHKANSAIRSKPQSFRGKSLALAGLIMGYLSIIVSIILIILIFTGILKP